MFVTAEEIARMEVLYGKPAEDRIAFEMTDREWDLLRRSQKHGRAHDVTLYVQNGEEVAVIAKHSYPPSVYRAPSGGVMPGESMEAGIAREAMEEIGVEVRLRRYLLRERVDFLHGTESVLWTTHVFMASPVTLELSVNDQKEIREARWIPMLELSGPIAEMLAASASAGLRYRGYLHKRVMQELSHPSE
jgi:8-oxo-dGTP pyrophosphatase MutT (NUDIX family)